MAKDILLKHRVEATEQMTQNWTFRVQESARAQKLHLNDKHVAVISCFHSTLRLKTQVEGTYMLNILALKIFDRNVSNASFRRIYTGY